MSECSRGLARGWDELGSYADMEGVRSVFYK